MIQEMLAKIKLMTETLGDDDPELSQMIETETQVDKLLDYFVFKYGSECDFQDAVAAHIETLQGRFKASQKRDENLRNVIQIIMEALPDKTKKLPAGTITLKSIAPKIIVEDESKLPVECFQMQPRLIKAKVDELYKANGFLSGCRMTNGGQTISIRRK